MLSEGRRKRLIDKFEEMFPDLAKAVTKYGTLRNDDKTLLIMTANGAMTFYHSFTNAEEWKLENYKSYVTKSRSKQVSE